jgi:hypothetical protein
LYGGADHATIPKLGPGFEIPAIADSASSPEYGPEKSLKRMGQGNEFKLAPARIYRLINDLGANVELDKYAEMAHHKNSSPI